MKLIILDRDGVINQDRADFVKSEAEWTPLPGSLQAIARLNHAGYKVIIASNQSGLGRGLFSIDDLNAMHQKLKTLLHHEGGKIEAIFFCPHHPDEQCRCRKPKPGMFEQIQQRYPIDMTEVYAVGDSNRDLLAASEVGCKPILVLTGNGLKTQQQGNYPSQTQVFDNLSEFVTHLLGQA